MLILACPVNVVCRSFPQVRSVSDWREGRDPPTLRTQHDLARFQCAGGVQHDNDDLLQYNLRRGQLGTVFEILANGNAFEVEFSSVHRTDV